MSEENKEVVPYTGTTRGFTKEVWFVHGANASPTSFSYIKEHLNRDPLLNDCAFVDITYDCQDNLASVVKILAENAPKDRQFYMIGHSLGGVLATAVAQRIKHFSLPVSLRGVFTMSAPFGGSESADYLKWLYPHYHLFRSISTQSRIIKDLKSVGAVTPTTSLVTTSGNNPLFPTANDGVVTVLSQRALAKVNYIEVPYNHFEVLVSKDTADHIGIFIKNH